MNVNSDAAMAVAFFVSAASVAWSAAFAYARWLARPRERSMPPPESDRQLANLQNAVDTIAIEVERLAEIQRYTLRVLEHRLPANARPLLASEPPASTAPD